MLRRAAAAAVLLTLAAAPARAVPNDGLTTFLFAGTCGDCTGTAMAQLVLSNYVLGSDIDDTNFVSFYYGGTNFIPAYAVTPDQGVSFVGGIDGPLSDTESLDISTGSVEFNTNKSGSWCTGAANSCASDQGPVHTWSVAAVPTSDVPEPTTASLLGAGLLGLVLLRRRGATAP